MRRDRTKNGWRAVVGRRRAPAGELVSALEANTISFDSGGRRSRIGFFPPILPLFPFPPPPHSCSLCFFLLFQSSNSYPQPLFEPLAFFTLSSFFSSSFAFCVQVSSDNHLSTSPVDLSLLLSLLNLQPHPPLISSLFNRPSLLGLFHDIPTISS